MPSINLAALVEDTLVDTYVRQRGERPSGSFVPDDKTLASLRGAFPNPEEMADFLRTAMFAHMSRTEVTRTPFWINSLLFSDSFLEYIEKHQKYLKSFYGNGLEPHAFEQSVYGAVLQSETDYLDICGNYYLRKGETDAELLLPMLSPTVWWTIWSKEYGRFDQLPVCWDDQVVVHERVKSPFERALINERNKLKDKARRDTAERAAGLAMREARMQWCGRYGMMRLLFEDGVARPADDSVMTLDQIKVVHPLAEADKTMFATVRQQVQLPPTKPRTSKPPKYTRLEMVQLSAQVAANDDM